MVYQTLNDAATHVGITGLQAGETEIWYCRPESFADFQLTSICDEAHVVIPRDLQASHVLLGKIAETDLERVFMILQGEVWSPNGEANTLITTKGLSHTSMSIGDIVRIGPQTFMCAAVGWVCQKSS